MPNILVDENIDGYAEQLERLLFGSEWKEVSTLLEVRVSRFKDVGFSKRTPDREIWAFCQERQFFLITDNRNQDKPDSLESVIRAQNLPTSLPVFTISDLNALCVDRDYAKALAARLLEYLFDADKILGAGRLYLP